MTRYSLYFLLLILTFTNVGYSQTNTINHQQLQKLIHTTDTTNASKALVIHNSGNDIVYGGAQTTIQDASKIALLMLNAGSYKGKKIVSPQWVKKSTTPSRAFKSYGYLWWINANQYDTPMENYYASGDFGQLTFVFPEKNLIYLREQSCNKEPGTNMIWMGQDFINLIGKVITGN